MRGRTTTSRGGARRRRVMVGASAVAAAVALGAAGPAGGGAPPPAETTLVGISTSLGSGPSTSLYRDCDGVDQPYASEAAILLSRSGDILGPLTVPLSWSGDMVPFLEGPPGSATFAAGDDVTAVTLRLTSPEPGPLSLTVTVEDGPDHDPGSPSPAYAASVDLGSGAPVVTWDCTTVVALADELANQTIEVGGVPEPLRLPFVADPPRDAPSPEQLFTEVVSGSLPPGLTYEDDTWGGAATTPGTYPFEVAVCTVPDTWLAPISVCMGRVAVTITVVDPAVVAPAGAQAPPAPPAAAVAAAATFTG